MDVVLKEKITGAAAWRGQDLANDSAWIAQLTEQDIASLDFALGEVKKRGLTFPFFTAADFPVDGSLSKKLQGISDELENGRGFLLLRGLPVHRYSDEEISILYYGIGLHMGLPVSQNPKGEMIGVVTNVGDLNNKNTRVYETNAYLPYHTDLSDVVGLLGVRKAKSGGLSSLVSAAAVYNEILEKYPHYLGLFYRPMYFAHLGEELPSLSPIFSFHQGKLSCRYLRQYLELGHEIRGVPLSNVEVEALDIFDSIIHDENIRLDMMLEPGDIQFANNYAVMHSRSNFEDFQELELRRRLLRLWLKMPNTRTLAPDFPGRNGIPARVAEAA
ncbi:TauD/TfdA family dioxygenase [Herbaspirillum sp. RV1423]|uniref:TauD/TfdA family dioxygenase n=1 Tax=Herbaspirillum sp. RV1423 TaxID=1443993 RepID=UPI0004AC61A2|nr:TauD/TfdA family dioxygenase [Herbaspirillum sp. RV1423]